MIATSLLGTRVEIIRIDMELKHLLGRFGIVVAVTDNLTLLVQLHSGELLVVLPRDVSCK